MEVTSWSRDRIKPSSPTPTSFETFHLYCLEKTSPLVYTLLFLFFPKTNNHVDSEEPHPSMDSLIDSLKSSLSEILNRFLFLEGEILGDSIHCSYEEAVFVKARVSGKMCEILNRRNKDDVLMTLAMYSMLTMDDPNEKYAPICVQANNFDCGGVGISLCLLHKVMDPTTIGCFLRLWFNLNTSSFNSLPSMACSDFGPLFSLFDLQQKQVLFSSQVNSKLQKGCFPELVLKDNAISNLKAEAESIDVENPTSVEVLFGSLWKCVLEVVLLQRTRSSHSPSILTHAIINLKMLSSSLPRFSMGNFWWVEVANYETTTTMELSMLVKFLRDSFLQSLNGDDYSWIKRLVGNQEDRFISNLLSSEIIPKLYICTNWEDIEWNEDFGWENTIWIDSNMTSKNIGILLRAIKDDEREIWIVLDEKQVELLVQNKEFCGFVNLTFP